MDKKNLIEVLNKFKELTEYDPGNPGLLKEDTQVSLVKDIQNFLNKGYEVGVQTEISPDGKFTNKKVVGVKTIGKDNKQEVVTNISPMDLFYRLEDEFKDKLNKGDKRTLFLKQNIIDWWNGYSDLSNGNLSKNMSV
jgi:hypothetical protein